MMIIIMMIIHHDEHDIIIMIIKMKIIMTMIIIMMRIQHADHQHDDLHAKMGLAVGAFVYVCRRGSCFVPPSLWVGVPLWGSVLAFPRLWDPVGVSRA